MNIGACPYDDCRKALAIHLPERSLPAYERHQCPHCKRLVWSRLSKVDPEAWTEADFEAEHVIDHAAKTIHRRAEPIDKQPQAL